MRRRRLKKETKKELLHTIYQLQSKWKRAERLLEESIDPTIERINEEKIARMKFMYLLNEARRNNIRAI